MTRRGARSLLVLAVALAALGALLHGQRPEPPGQETFRFTGSVDLVTVYATITDANGRFVSGLRKEDFAVYEDDQRIDVAQFSIDRVPVSLAVALDTSESMTGDKIKAARRAIERLLRDLVGREDRILLYRFGDLPILVQDWTSDRQLLERALERIEPAGATAMYDTIAQVLPLLDEGRNPKKALLVVSDGNDTSSSIEVPDLRQRIRASEALVYAVGIDGPPVSTFRLPSRRQRPLPPRVPIPFTPGRRGRAGLFQLLPAAQGVDGNRGSSPARRADPANVAALRDMTDDSGGRTEVIRDARELERAVAGIADELGRQYSLAYSSPAHRDGQWHSIRVEVPEPAYHVRARRGYVAN
ncbi:MAG: VWA domain-containing protein [Vicinamibacterales bacterium]